jgi:hypothetical protein
LAVTEYPNRVDAWNNVITGLEPVIASLKEMNSSNASNDNNQDASQSIYKEPVKDQLASQTVLWLSILLLAVGVGMLIIGMIRNDDYFRSGSLIGIAAGFAGIIIAKKVIR